MVATLIDEEKIKFYTPLEISNLGREVSQSSGSKEVEPIGSPITIEHISGESTISPIVKPYMEALPGQFPMTQELHGAGLKPNETISFPERQEVVLPLTPEQTINLSKDTLKPEKSKAWLIALSDRIRKLMDFRKKVQTA